MFGNFAADLFEDIILVVQIVFTPVTLPSGAVLRYFLHIFADHCFFMFLYFLRTIQLIYINFFIDVLGITRRVASLKKPFHSIFPSARSHFEIFWGSFWGIPDILNSSSASYLMKFCRDILSITLTVNILRINLQHVHLLWGLFCSIFGPVLGIFLKVLKNLNILLIFCTNFLILL